MNTPACFLHQYIPQFYPDNSKITKDPYFLSVGVTEHSDEHSEVEAALVGSLSNMMSLSMMISFLPV